MATAFDATLPCDLSTDARFQTFCSFIHNLLIAGGWVQTTDTGQFTPSTAAHPTTTQQKVGYTVYHMNDTLQATAPVFMRIDFGSRDVAAKPQLWFNIGSGSNGTGTITGPFVAEFITTSNANSTTANTSYGSASTNRLQLMMFNLSGTTVGFSIERSRDSTGAVTGDGLIVMRQDGTAGGSLFTHSRYVSLLGLSGLEDFGISFVLANRTLSAVGADVGIGLPILFKGAAQQPGIGVIVCNKSDFADDAAPTLAVYGTTHQYHLGASSTGTSIETPTGNGAHTTRAETRVGILYE